MRTATYTPGGPARAVVGLAAAAAVAVTLADPAARELCLLDLRGIATPFSACLPGTLLPDDDRTMWRRGELVLDPAWEARAQRQADCSADGFILDPRPYRRRGRFPPAEVWQDHPPKVWAALRGASRTRHRLVDARSARAGTEAGDIEAPARDRMLAAARLSRRAEPDNGAACLAEALAELSSGRLDEGLAALAESCEKPVWQVPQRGVFDEARRLYASLGLPRLAAAQQAARLHGYPQLVACVLEIRDELAVQAADLVRRGDDQALDCLLERLEDFRRRAHRHTGLGLPVPGAGSCDAVLAEAAAERLGELSPEELPRELVGDARQAVIDRFLWHFFPHRAVEAAGLPIDEHLLQRFFAPGAGGNRLILLEMARGLIQATGTLLLALLLPAAAADLAWSFCTRWSIAGAVRIAVLACAALPAAAATATALGLHPLFEELTGAMRLQDLGAVPAAICAVAAGGLLAAARVQAHVWRCAGVYRAAMAGGLCAYALLLQATGRLEAWMIELMAPR